MMIIHVFHVINLLLYYQKKLKCFENLVIDLI